MMSKIQVLDCTLRDGGYCNNCRFGFENEKKIVHGLVEANIDIIESMYLMLVPFTYFLVGALLQVQRTPSYLCRFLRQSSLLIYVSHILFAMPLLALFPDHHLLVYGAVIVCAQLLAVVIIALSNRFSWLKVLC